MARIERIADDLVVIDVHYNQTPQVIGSYLLLGERPALIETGPTSTLETLLAGVRAAGVGPPDPRAGGGNPIPPHPPRGARLISPPVPHTHRHLHSGRRRRRPNWTSGRGNDLWQRSAHCIPNVCCSPTTGRIPG